jgi:MFS family permease
MKKNDWILIIATALYSYLFYNQAAGINFFIFSIAMILLLWQREPSAVTRNRWLLTAAGTFISGAAVAIYGNWLSVWANVISLSLLSGMTVSTRSSVIMTLFHSVSSYGSSIVFMILDAIGRKSERGEGKGSSVYVRILLVIIPLLITLLFFFLYRGSNPIFNNFAKNINFDFITWKWVFFTLLGFILLYGFFYHRRIKELAQWDENAPGELAYREVKEEDEQEGKLFGIRNEYISGMLLFVMLNILLLVVNLLDIQFVYIQKILPEGLSHSEYVHQGIELLILSIIIAIGIILFVFRGTMNFYRKSKTLRILAALWIIQNMFMIISTIIRNNMYIAEYGGITYKRIGVYVYLALSLIGLITTWIKIWKIKSNWFLFRTNTSAWYWMLVVSSLINWDAIITNYNIGHASSLKELDKGYLIDLAPSTLPEMLAYNDTSSQLHTEASITYYDSEFLRQGTYSDGTLENQLHGKLYKFLEKRDRTGWQSWNYDDARIMREVQAMSDNGKIDHLSLYLQGISTLKPLRRMNKITRLEIPNNQLGDNLQDLDIFPLLQRLNISYNGIDSLERLPLLPKLQDLDISSNNPHSFEPLKKVPDLVRLNISSCQYVNLDQLPALGDLNDLDLSQNTIFGLSSLRKFEKLERLLLRNVVAEQSPREAFQCIPSLKTLDLSDNTLPTKNSSLLTGVVRCYNLEELILSGNQLHDIFALDRTIPSTDSLSAGLYKLRKLYLDRNVLQTIRGVEQFILLEELSISNNPITSFTPVAQLPNLKILYAGNNSFGDLSLLAKLTKLEQLDISHSGAIPLGALSGMTKMKWLNIAGTGYSQLADLEKMHDLEHAYLQENGITDVHSLSRLTHLQTLNITNNRIQDLTPLYSLKQLKELYVDPMPERQLEELKKALPNTFVSVYAGGSR